MSVPSRPARVANLRSIAGFSSSTMKRRYRSARGAQASGQARLLAFQLYFASFHPQPIGFGFAQLLMQSVEELAHVPRLGA